MLEVKNLKKKFGKNLVLKGIDLKVNKGDKIAIIGPSGCGKSTFLRCLNGIEEPTSGSIIFEGKENRLLSLLYCAASHSRRRHKTKSVQPSQLHGESTHIHIRLGSSSAPVTAEAQDSAQRI